MKKTCVIHIGLHKTGSSSIQNTLHKNRAILKSEFNINYYDKQANHGTLLTLFSKNLAYYRPLKIWGITDEAGINTFKSDLKADLSLTLKKNTSPVFVISGEGLSLLEEAEIHALQSFLAPSFDEFQIYAYVRDPMSHANSVGQQAIKGGMTFADIQRNTFGPKNPDDHPKITKPGSVYPYFRTRIAPYQKAFGEENVKVLNFSALRERKEDVVLHFMQEALGIKTLPQDFEVMRVNESLASDAVYLAEALNTEVPLFVDNTLNSKRSRGIITHLTSLKSEGSFTLPEFDFAALADIVSNDVAWLKTITKNRIDFTSMEPPKKSANLWPDLAPIARSLNAALIKEEKAKVSRDMFRALWLCSRNPDAARKSINCERLVRRCDDPKAMVNFAHSMKVLGFLDFALPAANRAIYLLDGTSDEDLYKRMVFMKNKLLKSQ